MKKMIFAMCVFGAVLAKTENLFADEKYKVVDGDSLEYGYLRIRLIDIDAPELFQMCYDEDNRLYECGKKATKELEKLMSNVAECKELGVDRYKRKLMECFGKDDISINQKMVLGGWAVSYGKRFKEEEKEAKKQKSGVWKGRFMRPELYRALGKNQKNTNKFEKR